MAPVATGLTGPRTYFAGITPLERAWISMKDKPP